MSKYIDETIIIANHISGSRDTLRTYATGDTPKEAQLNDAEAVAIACKTNQFTKINPIWGETREIKENE